MASETVREQGTSGSLSALGAQESVGQSGMSVYRRLTTQFDADLHPEASPTLGADHTCCAGKFCFQGITEADQHKMERGRLAHEPQ
jgi:hypothetical protein